jgi:2-polyprenyl-3-methyl-5-hydroxy-6-metoxy-1,4-benzoquinol methylase
MTSSIKTFRRKLKKTLREIHRLMFHTPNMQSLVSDSDTYWETRKGADFDTSLNSYQLFRAEWIIAHIENGATLLDVASGEGKILAHIRKQKQVIAIPTDNSDICLNYLKKLDFDPLPMDLADPNFDQKLGSYDHTILCEILEHLSNPEDVLMRFLAKTQKSVFFSVPNTGYFPFRLRLLFGRVPMQWRSHPGEHLRFWTYRDMKWWLQQLDLDQRSTICCYEGVPTLKSLWPSMFAAAMIVEVKTQQ